MEKSRLRYVNRSSLESFLDLFGSVVDGDGTVFLVGETSLVWAGKRPWSDEVEIAVANRSNEEEQIEKVLEGISSESGIRIIDEHPGDVIPLPDGWKNNCRPADYRVGAMDLAHFDPYSVSFRFLARGDEEDYKLVIGYLELGWVEMSEMDRQLEDLLPRFSFETIAQDPAEFRRKYKGLQQMARARGL